MAVLIEGISVVIRRDAIQAKVDGGWQALRDIVQNSTLCTDGLLARVGFTSPDGAKQFIRSLENLGLTFLENTTATDISVVDMLKGPTMDTPWLEFARLSTGKFGHKVAACWLFEGPRDKGYGTYLPGPSMELAVPEGWSYENSLTAHHTFLTGNTEAKPLMSYTNSVSYDWPQLTARAESGNFPAPTGSTASTASGFASWVFSLSHPDSRKAGTNFSATFKAARKLSLIHI